MEKTDFLKQMQRYVANIAISGSTLRNQGAAGVTDTARKYLAKLDLGVLKKIDNSEYPDQLDEWTEELIQELPKRAKNWGTARKAINVFLVQAFLNKYLANKYGLARFGNVLETPLDSQAASELRKHARREEVKLPRWRGIRGLKPETSSHYQEFASEVAKKKKIARACLDMILWRAGQ